MIFCWQSTSEYLQFSLESPPTDMYFSQEWLQKKKEKSRENMQIKKKEEGALREKNKRVSNLFCKLDIRHTIF